MIISSEFFKICMPYVMVKNSKNEWSVFNRRYNPLGMNSNKYFQDISSETSFQDIPIRNIYSNFTEKTLQKLIDDSTMVEYDEKGIICKIWFYKGNPLENETNWEKYLKKIQILSQLK